MKDHNSRSRNDRETFKFFEENDEVLGCKPNITPKQVLECGGLAADDTSAKTSDGEDSPNTGPSIHKSDEDQLEMGFEKTLPKMCESKQREKARYKEIQGLIIC